MLLLLTAWLLTLQALPAPEQRVRDFVQAFNGREIERMLALAADDLQWINVDGPKLSIEAKGRAALEASLRRMFANCPTCQSDLVWVRTAGSRVTALERASWTGTAGRVSQSSLSVYEFRDGKIARVYYFPPERDAPAK